MSTGSKVILFVLPLAFICMLALPVPKPRPEVALPAGDSGEQPPPPGPAALAARVSADAVLAVEPPAPASPRAATTARAARRPATETPEAAETAVASSPLALRVVDPSGHPVAGAVVEAHAADAPPGTPLRTSTDAAGRASLELRPGTVRLVAWKDALTGDLGRVTHRGEDTEHVVRLDAGQVVVGEVFDLLDGRPIEGAELWFATHAELDRAVTGRDGRFEHERFPGVEQSQQVHVRAPGYGTTVRVLTVRADDSWKLWGSGVAPEDQSGFGTPDISIGLAPSLEVTGLVANADGTAAADLPLAVEGYFEFLPGAATPDSGEARTDAEGRFTVRGLRSDVEHVLRVEAPGSAVLVRTLPAGSGTPRVDLGRLVLGAECLLTATVLDPEGRPAEGITVSIRNAAADARRTASRASGVASRPSDHLRCIQEIGKTDANGTRVFDGLPPGEYVVRVHRARGEWLRITTRVASPGEARAVTLDLPLEALTMTGTVLDHGAPVAGAEVTVKSTGRSVVVQTDARGRFRASGLEDSVAYSVEAVHGDSLGERSSAFVTDVFALELLELHLAPSDPLALR